MRCELACMSISFASGRCGDKVNWLLGQEKVLWGKATGPMAHEACQRLPPGRAAGCVRSKAEKDVDKRVAGLLFKNINTIVSHMQK